MRKERLAIVSGIIDHLAPAEQQIDLTIVSLAQLNGHLPGARVAAGLALETGHEAMAAFTEAQALAVRARAKIIEGHQHLALLQQSHRFPEQANGGLGDKNPNPPVLRAPLVAVA